MKSGFSYESSGGSTFTIGLKIFGYYLLAGIMSLFVSFSMNMLTTAAFTEVVGYREYEVINGESVLVDTVYFDEDTTYESEMTTATDDREVSREVITEAKSPTCATLMVVFDVLEQLLMLAILIGLTGYYTHREGDRDRNLVKHHDRKPTPLRGLWIGLIASAPAFSLFMMLVLGKCGFMPDTVQGIYRLMNACFTPLINVIMPLSTYPAAEIAVWQLVLLFLVWAIVPASCALLYYMGYKRTFKKWKKKFKKA